MRLLLAIQCLLLSLGLSIPSFAGSIKTYPSVPGELVVKLSSEPNQKTKNSFVNIALDLQTRLKAKSIISVRSLMTTDRFAVFKIKPSEIQAAIESLKNDSRVAYSEPNYLYHALQNDPAEIIPSDSNFGLLWGMKNIGQPDAEGIAGSPGSDIHVAPVWAEGITGSKNIKVAIIDTGIAYNHPDLKENVDASLGYNFVKNSPDAMDDHNHGTHCAGTIGGIGNNGVGVAGVNWKVTLIPIKFLNADGGGTLDAAVQSIQWAISKDVNIMSNSWGGGPYSQALYDVIAQARDKGITFIAAAGNDHNNNDANASYPASYDLPNVIAVAATDSRDHLAVFSNYGASKVHVAAPGVGIYSSVKDGTYKLMSGTSMATPHVAGIAALLLSANPSLSYSQIKDTLMKSSDKVRGLSRKVASRGRVNVYNAIHGIEPPDLGPKESKWVDYAYSAESPHPYANTQVYSYSFDVPNAKYVRVVFSVIDTEAGYDYISVKDANGQEIESLSGAMSNYTSDYLDGGKGTITLTTDSSTVQQGFKVAKLQVIY